MKEIAILPGAGADVAYEARYWMQHLSGNWQLVSLPSAASFKRHCCFMPRASSEFSRGLLSSSAIPHMRGGQVTNLSKPPRACLGRVALSVSLDASDGVLL